MQLTTKYEKFLRQNIPMLDFSKLEVAKIDDTQCIIKLPFIPENKNHLQSMYLGSQVMAGEVSAGLMTHHLINKLKINSGVVIKDLQVNFLRLAKSDIYFVFNDIGIVTKSLQETQKTKERVNFSIKVIGVEDLNNLAEPVSSFMITISVKAID